ncbi:hypothetical protein TEA_029600 [Camellia sinensis var. sinensis]|uniref:Uncharacterized protein n=1 Tax=Camellia sinensis var. sinensis TaxID=542762 RepID=A0A4S4DP05_CAMSN|nr:hypothetical protein TEA_029600 [Camellia sinensis var. sinensis]
MVMVVVVVVLRESRNGVLEQSWGSVPEDIVEGIWKEVQDEYNEQISMIDEPFKTEEVQDKIFHNLVGKDGHGYCKTYEIVVPRSAVYKKDISPLQTSSSSTVKEITQQLPNASSGQLQVRKSVGDHDSHDDELLGSPMQVLHED